MTYTVKANKKYVKQRKSRRSSIKFLLCAILVVFTLILISVTVKNTSASSDIKPRSKFYTSINIEQGQTLWDIAAEYSTYEYSDYNEYIDEIIAINGLKSEYIKSGDNICIPYYADKPHTDL